MAVVFFEGKVCVFIADVFVNTERRVVIYLHVIHEARALLSLSRLPTLTSSSLLSTSSAG